MDHRRIVITGATGNVGTATVRALAARPEVAELVGIARRRPGTTGDPIRWVEADVAVDDLTSIFRGADTVVHLAWLIQPTRAPAITWATNAVGSRRVFDAAAAAGVSSIVYLSSVAAYSPGPKDRGVTEDWPTDGWPGASYAREKAYVERVLDAFEARHPGIRVVRLRPGFILQRAAASEQRRLFAGPFLPSRLVQPRWLPLIPDLAGLRFQVVHADDVADAVERAVLGEASGPFNLAAEPVIDPGELAEMFGARVVRMPRPIARRALALAWRARLVPVPPGLLDALLRIPVLDTNRARSVLGWTPRSDARSALSEVLAGVRDRAGAPTPPLEPEVPGGRIHEIRTGAGGRP